MPIPVISPISGLQNIPLNTSWKLTTKITGSPTVVEVIGMVYPFHFNWIASTNTLELIGNPTRSLSGTWTIRAINTDGTAEIEVEYSVIPPVPVINSADLALTTITRGQPFSKLIRIENMASANVRGHLIGLDHEDEDNGVRIFGTVPSAAVFTIRGGEFTITAPHPIEDVVGMMSWQFPPEVPSIPDSFTADGEQGGGEVRLEWAASLDDGGSVILRYEYQYKLTSATSWGSWTSVGTNLFAVISGLTNYTDYDFRVRAVNAVGNSLSTAIVTVRPILDGTVPAVPTGFTLTPGDDQLTIVFTAPTDNGGHAILRYEYTIDGGDNWVSIGLVTSYILTGLTNGTAYTLQVRAVNPVGPSVATSAVTETPFALPGVPTSLTVAQGQDDMGDDVSGEADLSWTAPTDTGGFPIIRYEYRIDTGSWQSTGSTATTFTITALIGGTYAFEVRAVTDKGASAASNSVSRTIDGPTGVVPTAPRGLTVAAANPDRLRIVFRWSPPMNTGSDPFGVTLPILRYDYQINGGDWVTGSASLIGVVSHTSAIDSFAVRAVNAIGHGPASTITYSGGSWE